jgi:hypothetical protein
MNSPRNQNSRNIEPEPKHHLLKLETKFLTRIIRFLDYAECSVLAGTCKTLYRMIYEDGSNFSHIDLTKYEKPIPMSLLLKLISYAGDHLQTIKLPIYFNSTDTLK